jgi:hypothetical protein
MHMSLKHAFSRQEPAADSTVHGSSVATTLSGRATGTATAACYAVVASQTQLKPDLGHVNKNIIPGVGVLPDLTSALLLDVAGGAGGGYGTPPPGSYPPSSGQPTYAPLPGQGPPPNVAGYPYGALRQEPATYSLVARCTA